MTITECLTEGGIKNRITTSFWRCGKCERMVPSKTNIFYVEDSVRIGDSWESIVYRQNRLPLNCTGWCLSCANKLLPTDNIFTKLFRRIVYEVQPV